MSRFGLEHRLIDAGDAVSIAVDYVSKKDESSWIEIELAGLLRSELYRVPELVGLLTADQESGDVAKSKWLYLVLAWLYEQRDSVDDPLGIVEQIYADFGHPEEMSSFVRYMPPTDGYRPQDHTTDENHERLFRLWHEFVLKKSWC